MKVFLLLLLQYLVISTRKILIAPYQYAYSHVQVLYLLADRISKDPLYECYMIQDPSFIPLWPINCTILYSAPVDPEDTIFEDAIKTETAGEQGVANVIPRAKKTFNNGYSYWMKAGLMNKLEEIGIDIAICDYVNMPCLIFAYKLKIPFLMFFSPVCFPGTMNHRVDPMTSYIPISTITKATSKMGFFKRFVNLLGYQIFVKMRDMIASELSYEYTPDIFDNKNWKNNTFSRKEALYVQACVPSFNYPELLPPNIINSGAIINKKVSKLSEDTSSFLDNFNQSVYISFGTLYNLTDLPTIVKLCAKLSNIGFILSYKGRIKETYQVPDNLRILNWTNQVDLLASHKISVFVTHAGWNSVLESILHAVPMVACGWSYDRDINSLLIEERKIGLRIKTYEEFNSDNLEKKLLQILNDKRFKENIEKYSRVVQKSDGAAKVLEALDLYFNPGIENLVIEEIYTMNWIQFYNIDVWVFEILLVAVVFYLVFMILRRCFRYCFLKQQIDKKNHRG